MATPKKLGTLPVADSEEQKQTNEIGVMIPLLDAIDISGREITADALHTQRKLATYLVEQRDGHYHFSVEGNPALNTSCTPIAATGVSRTRVTTRWIGTMTKIAASSAPASARRMSRACAASPSV